MNFEQLKAGLLELLAHADAEEDKMVEGLSDSQRAAVGMAGRWSARDVVAHIASWKRQAALVLEAASHGAAHSRIEDIDAFNARVLEEARAQGWPDVRTDSDRARGDLVASLQGAAEVVLTNADRFEWKDGRPLWKLVMCDGFEHPVHHLVQFHARDGDSQRAIEVQVRAVEALRRYFEDPEYISFAQYDLGCLRLKSGQREGALTALREAFQLNPALVAESREDAELASIRSELDSIR